MFAALRSGLRDTAVGVEISVGDVGADTETPDGVTAIGVDSLDVDTVTGPEAVEVVVP